MPDEHSVLAPSAAERWIQCPASIRMERHVETPPESSYAMEGTAAHALAHLTADHLLLKGTTKRQFTAAVAKWRREYADHIYDEADMQVHVAAYVDYLRELRTDGSVLLLEQRVPTGVPSCWGTSDAVVVSPTTVEIVDLKYGQGHQVEAHANPQLRLYGVGALEAFGDLLGDVETVRTTVFQPRLDHVVTEELTSAELREWRDSIIPVAESALGHDAPFGPSDDACRWCPAAGQCTAQLEWATALDFAVEPEVLTADELAIALERIPAIEAWCAAVRDYALDLMYSKSQPVPGYKVVMSGGKRSVTDQEGAMETLQLIGYTLDDIANTKIKGIGDLEKLLGKRTFKAVLEDNGYVTKGKGSPAVVPTSDNRPSVTPDQEAVKEFSDE